VGEEVEAIEAVEEFLDRLDFSSITCLPLASPQPTGARRAARRDPRGLGACRSPRRRDAPMRD
jgi:hypothetical protein